MAGTLMSKAVSMMFTAVLGVIFFAYLLVPVVSDASASISDNLADFTGMNADVIQTLLGVVLIVILMGIAYGAIKWVIGEDEE